MITHVIYICIFIYKWHRKVTYFTLKRHLSAKFPNTSSMSVWKVSFVYSFIIFFCFFSHGTISFRETFYPGPPTA